jgi:gluconate 2-dehydrogenase gamma chain
MTQERQRDPGAGAFFDAHQHQTVEAAMARIIPTDEQPGAREAGTVEFLDRYLSGLDFIYAKPDGSGFEKLEGKRAGAWQKRIDILRDKYVEGIKDLDRRSREQFGSEFVQLTPEQQDRVLSDMEHPVGGSEAALEESKATAGFAPPEPALQQTSHEVQLEFFPLLALHTRQGFYADSIYGGNKDHVGWQLIGFDGPATLAETHSGRYTTRPYFADAESTSRKGGENGAQG